jgi:SAM-dependent methyltransferase
MAAPPRPVIDERRAYIARATQERWIVPLLNAAILASLDAHAHPRPGAKALDAGCGGQPFRAGLERRGYRYFGLDAAAAPGVTPDFLCPLDASLPAPCRDTGPFDLILCTEVLEHVADWPAALANLHLLLAPRGVLLLTCPFVYPLHEEPYDFWRPTPHALSHWAARSGLTILEQRQLGDAWDVLGTIAGAARPKQSASGPVAWACTRLARSARKLACAAASSSFLRSRVALDAPLHLSNLVVLTR